MVMFHAGDSEAQRVYDNETEKAMSLLPQGQKPKFTFCLGPEDILVRENDIDLVPCKLASDGLEGYDLTVPLDVSRYISAKEVLAVSDLPTPECDPIKVGGHSDIPGKRGK